MKFTQTNMSTLKTSFIIFIILSLLFSTTGTSLISHTLSDAPSDNTAISSDPKITAIINSINESLLREYLTSLVGFAPRVTGTYGCQQAATYIHQQFTSMNLETRYQNWTGYGNRWHPGKFNSQNVEGKKQGITDDKIVIFNAHYDGVGTTPGADDNGDGTAAVLAAAYALSKFSFNHTVVFLGVSGEEEGLLGSHAYAKEAYDADKNIIVDLNADMIGHTETAEGGEKIRTPATADAQWVVDTIFDINSNYNLPFSNISRSVTNEEGSGGSDYFSFVEYGFETVAFFEGEWNPQMHLPGDDINNVNFSYLVNTTRLIAATMAYLADHDVPNPQVRIASPRFGFFYFDGREMFPISDLKTIILGDIVVWAEVKPGTSPVVRAEFYYDNNLTYVDTEPPFSWHLTNRSFIKEHKISVIIYDSLGHTAHDWKNIRYIHVFEKRQKA